MENSEIKRAVLVSICESSAELSGCEKSLDELERLLNTAGGESLARIIQIKSAYDPRTVIGKGKVLEIKELCLALDVELVVFDVDLSPMQIRNLETDIECAEVIDRSMLILDIFALHATSGEGKLQVELAQLKYSSPRLIGKGKDLSRLGGGIGTRGPGETKLETDRRHLHERISALEEKLRQIEHNRGVMRRSRDASGLSKIAIVGYTNAGKSTLLNYLTGAGVLAEDKLFATLDATTRRLELPCGETVLLTDTVGFIRKLPHHLVEAFKSTLDEVKYADILLIISDITDPEVRSHIEVTESIIEQLGASDKPRIYVYNKADGDNFASYLVPKERTAIISAKTGKGVDSLLSMIEECVHEGKKRCKISIPFSEQRLVNTVYSKATVISCEYLDDGVEIIAVLDGAMRGALSDYISYEE